MATALDQIVQVNINLDNPPIDTANFGNLCLLGQADGDVIPLATYWSTKEVGKVFEDQDPIYLAAQVAFAQSPKPNRIVIAQYDGTNASLEAALDYGGWYGICPVGLDETETADLVKWVAGQERIAILPHDSITLPSETNDRCAYIYTNEGLNPFIHVAYMAKFLSYRPGSEAWENKTLGGGITAYPLSGGDCKNLDNYNVSYYLTVAGRSIVRGGKTSGGDPEWIDVVRFRDWLKNDMQLRVFTLMLTNPKLPFTDDGINMVRNQMEASLQRGQEYGGVAPDEFDADGTPIPGYTVTVPLAASLRADEKSDRKLIDCRFSARLAGAIRLVEIYGELTYNSDTE